MSIADSIRAHLHLYPIVAHGRIAVWRALQVEIDELLQIGPHDLVRVDKDDAVELQREEDIEEEYLHEVSAERS